MVLARRASNDKKKLARQVIPLAPGYRTALLSRPVLLEHVCVERRKRKSLMRVKEYYTIVQCSIH